MFVFFGSGSAFVPRTYHPGHSSPPGLILLHVPCPPPSPPPPLPLLLSCILHQVCTLPCLPVLYIYPNQVSGLSLPCLPVLYLNPTKMNPSTLQTPHKNCVSLLFPKQFHHQYNSKISPFLYPPSLPAPAPLTYNGSLSNSNSGTGRHPLYAVSVGRGPTTVRDPRIQQICMHASTINARWRHLSNIGQMKFVAVRARLAILHAM